MQRSQDSLNEKNISNSCQSVYNWAIQNRVCIKNIQRTPIFPTINFPSYYQSTLDIEKIDYSYENIYSIEIKERDLMNLISRDNKLSQHQKVDLPILKSIMEEKIQIEQLCKKFPALDQAKKNYELILKMVKN